MKRIYVVRHCKADGQRPEARLTAEGEEQAEALADFLQDKGVERIVSSPFLRALQSVEPLAVREIIDFPVETTVVASHGNLIALMLKHFDNRTGFAEWQALTNPDIYLVSVGLGPSRAERVWR